MRLKAKKKTVGSFFSKLKKKKKSLFLLRCLLNHVVYIMKLMVLHIMIWQIIMKINKKQTGKEMQPGQNNCINIYRKGQKRCRVYTRPPNYSLVLLSLSKYLMEQICTSRTCIRTSGIQIQKTTKALAINILTAKVNSPRRRQFSRFLRIHINFIS